MRRAFHWLGTPVGSPELSGMPGALSPHFEQLEQLRLQYESDNHFVPIVDTSSSHPWVEYGYGTFEAEKAFHAFRKDRTLSDRIRDEVS